MNVLMNQSTGPCDNGLDGNRMTAKNYAELHRGAYLEASDEVRAVIDAMARICADPNADPEDRESALDTLTDALFPKMHKGELGVDLEELKCCPSDGTDVPSLVSRMETEEGTFASRLSAAMSQKQVSQAELADKTGVGQPAISMMIARNCRPQKRTVKKFAEALGVTPDSLWPGFNSR